MKVEVVKKRFEANGDWDYQPNSNLRKILEWRCGNLEEHITLLFKEVLKAINKEADFSDYFIRIIRSDNPKEGWAFRRNLRGGTYGQVPDIVVGFANDYEEFDKTLIHEVLHMLNWDEEVVEAKTQEIHYKKRG